MQATAAPSLGLKDEKSSSPSLFDQIYEIAKNAKNDKDTIKKLSSILTPNTCIDVRDSAGIQTPAAKLAQEGNKEAIDLLMKLGANVNDIARGAAQGGHRDYAEHLCLNHGASVNYIASGAAQGGDWDYAEHLCLNGANVNDIARGAAQGGHRDYAEHLRLNHGAKVNDIARGAAQGGDRDYAEHLRLNHGAEVSDIARGAAQGGDRDYAEHLRRNHDTYVDRIARGAAQGGHRDYAEHLRRNYGAYVNDIAKSAAQGGDRDYAEHLRRNHGAYVNEIAQGAAQGGHRDYAEHLRLNHGADVSDIARGAAQGGHRGYAEHLRLNYGADVAWIVWGAARGGDRDYAEHLHLNHGANVACIVRGAADSGDFANTKLALHSLCFMRNNNYRTQIAQELKDQKLVPYDVTKLVPKAERIIELRPKFNYSQCIALGNREIQTWYLQCAVLIGGGRKELALNLFLSIATYLSPLTSHEASDLYKKSRFDMYQKLLVKGVHRYCVNTRTLFFFNRDIKAEEFSVACNKAKDNSQLIILLSDESKRINGDEKSQQNKQPNPYIDLIAKNLKRLG